MASKVIRAGGLIVLLIGACMLLGHSLMAGEAPHGGLGDVYVAVGDGAYNVYDSKGQLKTTIADGLGGYTTDCGFSPTLHKLYTTNFTYSKVVVFDPKYKVSNVVNTREIASGGQSGSIVFDANGHFFVGHRGRNTLIHKYDPNGLLISAFPVKAGSRGTSSIDLAADQNTLFYTSEGRDISRFDTGSQTQLSAFAELPGSGTAYALRLLPPGDGSGGLLVADGENIKRLNGVGKVVQTYDATRANSWFSLNLDHGGTSFWAADHETDTVYRFNIDSGAIEQRIIAGNGNNVFGVCVKGERTAAIPQSARSAQLVYEVYQNAPNPFNPDTQISYQLPETGEVSLVIYNLLGQQVRTLVKGEEEEGLHKVIWDGNDAQGRQVASGLYLYRFVSDGLVKTHKMLLLK